MTRCRSSSLVPFVLLLLLAAWALPAFAKPPEPTAAKTKRLAESLTGSASRDYEAARMLMIDGDFAGALIKFQAAYDRAKDHRLLWNLASCEKSMRHYARAIALLKRYLVEGGKALPEKDRKEAEVLVSTLEPFTIALTIEVSQQGAEVDVDGQPAGKSPLKGPLVVDIGQRMIRARKEGFREGAVTMAVGGSPQQTVTLNMEREVHEGTLSILAPPNATITIDGQPSGNGRGTEAVDARLPSGGHTLRVMASGMRVYEREVVLKDNETRTVEVQLEREVEASLPSLRVAVGCIDSRARGTDEGLAVFLDGSPTALVTTGSKKTWNAAALGAELDFVEYRVAGGQHDVIVRIDGCEALQSTVVVDPIKGGEIKGSLPTAAGVVARGPAGNPDWGRIALGVWLPGSLSTRHDDYWLSASPPNPDVYAAFHAAGVFIQPAIVFRWWTLLLDVGLAKGSLELTAPAQVAGPAGDVSWFRAGLRSAGRLPLNVATLLVGVGAGYDGISFTGLAPDIYDPGREPRFYVGPWLGLDLTVFCDWALVASGSAEGDFDGRGTLGVQIGAAFQPNTRCHGERSQHELIPDIALGKVLGGDG